MRLVVLLFGERSTQLGSMDISVGEGTQSFKWLAIAIEGRISQFKLLRKAFSQDNVVVVEIQNECGELIDPSDKICEHCISESLVVRVKVREQVAIVVKTLHLEIIYLPSKTIHVVN